MNAAGRTEDLDEVLVQVSFGTCPDGPPDEVFMLNVGGPTPSSDGPWQSRPYLEVLQSLLENRSGRGPAPHRTQVIRDHYSWGAAGETATILLHIASASVDGAAGMALYAAVKHAFSTISTWARATAVLPDREEAIDRAKWRVCMAYGDVARDDLSLVGEEEIADAAGWIVTLRTPLGDTYNVEVTLAGGRSEATRISRQVGRRQP